MEKKRTTLSGKEPEQIVPGAPAPIDPKTGMHKDYWILSDEERAKGFVQPVRYNYVHDKCGTSTKMGVKLAETYARDPKFYGSTFCVCCKGHFPVSEFLWEGTDIRVGSMDKKPKPPKVTPPLQRGKYNMAEAMVLVFKDLGKYLQHRFGKK